MKNKFYRYYDYSTSFVMGIIFIIIGILLLVGKESLYKNIISITVLVFLLISVFNFIKFLTFNRSVRESSNYLISCIFNLVILFLFIFLPRLLLGFLPFLFSLYMFIIGVSNLIMYLVLLKNRINHKIRYIVLAIIYFLIGVPILFNPVGEINTFIICFSVYIIVLGVRYVLDSIYAIIPVKTKNNIKRHIRVTLPKLLEAIIPYSVMIEINRELEMEGEYNYNFSKNEDANMYIIVHTSNRGVNRFGHMDIYINGNVISYGSYDEGTRKFRIFGDGVIFICDRLDKYINFCIDHSKKTVFVFGIRLSERQLLNVTKRVNQIMSDTYSWNYKDDKRYKDVDTYASKLYKKTHAKFYKFRKGKYKTYYVLGTNCCYLVDDVVGKSGTDILSLNGIVTPGTYYDYLNREFYKKNSIVVSKDIYNANRRAKK